MDDKKDKKAKASAKKAQREAEEADFYRRFGGGPVGGWTQQGMIRYRYEERLLKQALKRLGRTRESLAPDESVRLIAEERALELKQLAEQSSQHPKPGKEP